MAVADAAPGHRLAHAEAHDEGAAAGQRAVDARRVVDGAKAALPAADLGLGSAPFFVAAKDFLRGNRLLAAIFGLAAAVGARPARASRRGRRDGVEALDTVGGSDNLFLV